jgi:DNA primase
MNSDTDEIKNRIDIVEFISEYVPLKRAGQNYKAPCPFHSEKTPSFMVSPQKQIFHCFGCGEGGDIFGFVMKYEGMDFREALEFLAGKAGVQIRKQDPGQQGVKQKLKAIQNEAMEFFAEHLARSGDALGYLKDRGIKEAAIEDFSLGHAPPGWHNLHEHLKGKGYEKQSIMQSGLVATGEKGAYDVFRNRIIFPIFDMQGELIAFGGRALGDGQPKYLNSPDTPLFRKSENLYALNRAKEGIRDKNYAIVVEGYMDAIMCHQYGIMNVVAPLGTALTEGHLRKIGRLVDNVLLVFDGDRAGTAAAKRSLPLITAHDMRAKVLLLPDGQDPDSILLDHGPDHLRKLIGTAFSPMEFLLNRQGAERLSAINDAVETVSKAKDPIFRDELILELSERSGINERSIREKLNTYKKTGSHSADRPRERPYDGETLLLSAAVSVPGKAEDIIEKLSLDEIKNPLIKDLLGKIAKQGRTPDSLMGSEGTDEERALLTKLSINPGFDIENIDRNIDDCIRTITRKRMDEEIRTAEMAGDLKLLKRLTSERQKLIQGAT